MEQQKEKKYNLAEDLVLYSKEKPKLYLSFKVKKQIEALCKAINTVEWSGVLYHSSEGDINDIKTFSMRAEYILLLDKGSSGFTSYDFSSPLFTDAIMQKDEFTSGEWAMSHIHSHHSMSTFFSGTDQEELVDNAPNYNYYLSLIVNNKGEYSCRVSFVGKIEGRVLKVRNKLGENVVYQLPDQDKIFYVDVDVIEEEPIYDIDDIKENLGNNVTWTDLVNYLDTYDNTVYGTDQFFDSQLKKVEEKYKQPVGFNNSWSKDYPNFEDYKNHTKVGSSQLKMDKLLNNSSNFLDVEAIDFLKYFIVTDYEKNIKDTPLLEILNNMKVSGKGYAINSYHLDKRLEHINEIMENFQTFSNKYDNTPPEVLWENAKNVLKQEPFSKIPSSKLVLEKLNSIVWEIVS